MKTLVVARRELGAYFVSPVSYLITTLFLIVQGYSFWLFLRILNERPMQHGAVLQYFFGGTVLFWLFVMFLAAVITMRLLAEERRAGTLEPLLTAPVSEASVVAVGQLRELRPAALGLERLFQQLTTKVQS